MTIAVLCFAFLLSMIAAGLATIVPEAGEAIDWPLLIGASIVMALTPGANQLLSLANGFRAGFAPAMTAVCGRFAAFLAMVAGVAVGLGHWLATSAVVFETLKWLGVVYLLYLGWRSWMTAWRPGAVPRGGTVDASAVWPLMRREALVALSNPKAYVLFALFLPQFLQADTTAFAPAIALAGVVYILIEFACSSVYAGVGCWFAGGAVSRQRQRWLGGTSGVAMIGLAGWLALEKRPG